jgi:photosystem II PsbW protein|mmetsp:Transcript_13373/g.38777  ORF Transcript_13373/g.38777 Transcript_13373/m.38777 type:complete len:141 (-) Transcript_13373:61-483(-)
MPSKTRQWPRAVRTAAQRGPCRKFDVIADSDSPLLAPCTAATAARASRAKTVTVCAAQKQNMMAKAAAAGIPITTLLAAHPALALVDDRLATEGTGKIFGINDNAIFWNMLAIFGTVWAVFYLSQKDLGGDEDDDAGLTL